MSTAPDQKPGFPAGQDEVDSPSEATAGQIAVQVSYDQQVAAGHDAPSTNGIDPQFAETIRLLHDMFDSVEPIESDLANPFGRFRVLRRIDGGSFGTIWQAYDPLLHREVAIKVPRVEVRMDSELVQRFLQEAHAAGRLNHPSIVRVLDAGRIDGIPYITSEFVEGETMAAMLRRSGPIDSRKAAMLVRQLADAAHHAHQRGVLHRDIKPDNVIMEAVEFQDRNANRPKTTIIPRLTDFGLARVADAGRPGSQAGMMIGSPNYMAPEQAMGRPDQHGPPTDVYALGVMLYELLTDRLPHSLSEKSERVRNVPPPSKSSPTIPRDLDAVCLRCLQYLPENRYQTAGELRDDLIRFITGHPTCARPLRFGESILRTCKANRGVVAAVSMIMLGLIVIGTLILFEREVATKQNNLLRRALLDVEIARERAAKSEQKLRELSWQTGMQRATELQESDDTIFAVQVLEYLRDIHPSAHANKAWAEIHTELMNRSRITE